jgi:hypothetical protein
LELDQKKASFAGSTRRLASKTKETRIYLMNLLLFRQIIKDELGSTGPAAQIPRRVPEL